MKKLWLAIGLASLLAAPAAQAAFDGTVGITGSTGRIGTGGGGPFTVDIMTGLNGVVEPFLSFCLELDENITLLGNQGYRAVLNNEAIKGGDGGPSPDPISKATAWLYSQFVSGGYTGLDALFNANETGLNKINKGRDSLQQAIWWLEEESLGVNNYLVAAAVAATGAADAFAARNIDANYAYNVGVLNLYSNDGLTKVNQDMLVIVPEPSTYVAAALLLLPFGASTLRILRKKSEA